VLEINGNVVNLLLIQSHCKTWKNLEAMTKRLITVGLLTFLLFGALFGWKIIQIKAAKESHRPPPPPTVAVTKVLTEKWSPFHYSIGSLVATKGIDVSNELSGKVTAIHFESGQLVDAGQLLIELDTSTEVAELKRLEAARGLANIKFKRAAELLSTSFVSKSNYDETRALLDQADASLLLQKSLIAKKQIRAPFAGKLGIRSVDIGQYLSTGTSVVPLQTIAPLYADFSLPERYLSQLSPGQTIEIHVQAYPDQIFEGIVEALNPGIETTTRNVKLRAIVSNESSLLRPGMFVRVLIRLGEDRQILTLPDTAITYNTYGESVFIIIPTDDGQKAERRQVKTGQTRDGRVEITSGLTVGQAVVSAGQVKLRNGINVFLDGQPAPGERSRNGGDRQ
jgi:membrane fusion protein (multidrug efflux system)